MKVNLNRLIGFLGRRKSVRKIVAIARRHQLSVMVTGAVVLSLILTIFNVALYQASPVSDLDLSRPGYEPVRDRIEPNKPQKTFSAEGKVDEDVLNEFESLYKTQVENLNNSANYADPGLNDDHLGIGNPQ